MRQRHVTRQKILNWKQSLKFPPKPRVSHEGINLMQQLLCEAEDRLGSQATSSVSRPNSLVVQARRSGFVYPNVSRKSIDGAEHIKVRTVGVPFQNPPNREYQSHPWFRGIDWANLHLYPAPFRPELRNPEDTRHFDDDIPNEVRLASHSIELLLIKNLL